MSIKAEVTHYTNSYTADVEFSETSMSFYGPAWEIGFFFGLVPLRGKTKELLRINYDDIEEVTVGKTPFVIKKDACLIKLKNGIKRGKNPDVYISFIPFEAGRSMLFSHVGDRFI